MFDLSSLSFLVCLSRGLTAFGSWGSLRNTFVRHCGRFLTRWTDGSTRAAVFHDNEISASVLRYRGKCRIGSTYLNWFPRLASFPTFRLSLAFPLALACSVSDTLLLSIRRHRCSSAWLFLLLLLTLALGLSNISRLCSTRSQRDLCQSGDKCSVVSTNTYSWYRTIFTACLRWKSSSEQLSLLLSSCSNIPSQGIAGFSTTTPSLSSSFVSW